MTGILRLKLLDESKIIPTMGMYVLSAANDALADVMEEMHEYGRVEVKGLKYFIGPITDIDQFRANEYNHLAKILVVDSEFKCLPLHNEDYIKACEGPMIDRIIEFQEISDGERFFAKLEN